MLERLLRGPVEASPCENVAQWWPLHRELCLSDKDPLSRAIAGGFTADRVGWAFASGYQAALHALFPGAPDDRICALCVTEAEGNSPRAIKSSLRKDGNAWVLNGSKHWTTLGPDGSLFYVAARDEAASGDRISLKIIRVDANASGVRIVAMPPTKFVPEVPHAQLQFGNVNVPDDALLPGDGYANYVKPFRTVEDIYVNAAILAYLVREARRLAWPEHWIEKAVSVLVLFQQLSTAQPSVPETHIAVAGALAINGGLIGETDALWEAAAADAAAERWKRDRELLKVAAGIRAQRTKRAWENLRRPGPAG